MAEPVKIFMPRYVMHFWFKYKRWESEDEAKQAWANMSRKSRRQFAAEAKRRIKVAKRIMMKEKADADIVREV
jgi:hypothetical protein